MEMEPGRGDAFQVHRVFEEVKHLLEICVNDLGTSQEVPLLGPSAGLEADQDVERGANR